MIKYINTVLVLCAFLYSQSSPVRIATYNILNFPGSTGDERVPSFQLVLDEISPDILVVQEMLSQDGADTFLNDVLNYSNLTFAASNFINGYDTDNMLYYNPSKVDYINQTEIATALRDINGYTLSVEQDTFTIYSVHLKASQGSTNEQKRLEEVQDLHSQLNWDYPSIVAGDFNIYTANESAYNYLLDDILLIDPLDAYGNWHNNSQYAYLHSQSTRTTDFGGGSTGGMDDRFDMILISDGLTDNFIDGSYTSYGNDGQHLNMAINDGNNGNVSQEIANALHLASDHLPVYADFLFTYSVTQGDVNADGSVDIFDIQLIINFMLGLAEATSDQFETGDLNNDGFLDIFDIIQITFIILGR
tara:strand:- start:2629 stop:3711 length:1083 start_codon:yes stop_codon:yes gene_type:complete